MQPIVFVCGIHKKKLKLSNGKSIMYYMCPNYKYENRTGTDNICYNFVSINVINDIKFDIMNSYDKNRLYVGYENYIKVKSWRKKNNPNLFKIYYKVLEISEDCIVVGVLNTRKKSVRKELNYENDF